jgi:predicted homoserine dehydrogenase-like protein
VQTAVLLSTAKGLILAGILLVPPSANANYRCQYRNGVIVEVTICARETTMLGRSYGYQSEEAARQQRKAEMWRSYREGSKAANEATGQAIANALFGKSSQQKTAVEAKLNQIKEIDALYNTGSISKAQADALKRSVSGN